jgi:hypothetical protein
MGSNKNDYFNWKTIQQHRRTKERAVQYKGGKCERCGYSRCIASLHFHHTDPSKKDFQISGRVVRWENLFPELDKCQLVCSNCHGEIHHAEREERLKELERRAREQVPKRRLVGWKPCKGCATQVKDTATFCSRQCKGRSQEKGLWPNEASLRQMFKDLTLAEMSERLNLSQKTVRKKRNQLLGG